MEIKPVIPFNSKEEAHTALEFIKSVLPQYLYEAEFFNGIWIIPSPKEIMPDWRSLIPDGVVMPSDTSMIFGQPVEEYTYG